MGSVFWMSWQKYVFVVLLQHLIGLQKARAFDLNANSP